MSRLERLASPALLLALSLWSLDPARAEAPDVEGPAAAMAQTVLDQLAAFRRGDWAGAYAFAAEHSERVTHLVLRDSTTTTMEIDRKSVSLTYDEHYDLIKLNEPVSAALFVFTPPEGAKEVQNLGTPEN